MCFTLSPERLESSKMLQKLSTKALNLQHIASRDSVHKMCIQNII